jgi:hypothetical protein
MRENMQQLSSVWLVSLNMTISSSIPFPAKGTICIQTHRYTHTHIHTMQYHAHIFFFHSSVVGHLGWFHISAVRNSAALNRRVQGSLLYADFFQICLGAV